MVNCQSTQGDFLKIKAASIAGIAVGLLVFGVASPASATNIPIRAITCGGSLAAGAMMDVPAGFGVTVTLNNSAKSPSTYSASYGTSKTRQIYVTRSPWTNHQGGIARSGGNIAAGAYC